MSEEHGPLEEQNLDPRSVLQLYQLLGRIESSVNALGRDLGRHRSETNTNMINLGARVGGTEQSIARFGADMQYVKATVDRIRKPVDAFISLRNLIIGGAALVAALGAIFTVGPAAAWHWASGFFHQGQ